MANNSDLVRVFGAAALVEAVAGTYGAPNLTTDGIRLAQAPWSNISLAYNYGHIRDGVASGSIIPLAPGIPSGPVMNLDLWVEMRGAGSDVVPEIDDLLQACGYTVTDGASIFTYVSTPTGTAHKTCSIALDAGGMRFTLKNCRGNFVWPIVAGEFGLGNFQMQGIMDTEAAGALQTFTYDATVPLPSVNLAISIGGWAAANLDFASGEFDSGGSPVLVPSANAAEGIQEFGITERKATFMARARGSVTNHDPIAILAAGTAGALSMQYGTTQFNKIKLSDAAMTILPDGISFVDNEGFTGYEVKYHMSAPTILFD